MGNDEVEIPLGCWPHTINKLYRNGEFVRSDECGNNPLAYKYKDAVVFGNTYTYTIKYFYYTDGQLVDSGEYTLGTVTAGKVWGTITADRTLTDVTWALIGDLKVPAGVTLTLTTGSTIKIHPESYYYTIWLDGSLVLRNAHLDYVRIMPKSSDGNMSIDIADSIMDNVSILGPLNISITNSLLNYSINIDTYAPVAKVLNFSLNRTGSRLGGTPLGWIKAIAPAGMSMKGNSTPGVSLGLAFDPSASSISSPVTIEDNVFTEMIIGPYPGLVKVQNNTIDGMTVKHGLGQVIVEGNKGGGISVFRDASIDPLIPPPVYDDYQVIIRSNAFTRNYVEDCQITISIGGDPANANAAAAYPETGIYRVEGNSIDTPGYCPYTGRFNNGIALLGGASNNLIANNSIKSGDVGIWLNGISATTGNIIRGNFVHDGRYGIKMTGDVRNNTVEKSNIYNMKYNGFYLVGNYSQSIFVEGNIFKENELEKSWNSIRMDSGVKGNHFYNNIFKNSTYWQVDATNNKVCKDANSALIYCPNILNKEKTAGTNIIGGPYIGGNYWGTSYNGVDADKDGLGDTPFVPFSLSSQEKDNYPLVYELTVNRTGDQSDADLNDGRCDVDLAASGDQCTLRAAIQEANKRPGKQIIAFSISSTGIPVITPQSPLPEIIDTITIDASTQPGGRVTVNGTATASGTSGLSIKSGDTMIAGLNITGFPGNGITSSGAGYLAMKNVDISNNGGYGAIAEGGIFVNIDPLPPYSKYTKSSTPSRVSQNGVLASTGGLVSKNNRIWANLIEVSGNNGPGIAAKGDILLSAAQLNNNKAVGIQSIFGSITFDPVSLTNDNNQVIGNQGPGILAGADLMLGSPGGMVTIQSDIQVSDNAGWGIAAPGGGVAINAIDVGTTARISAKTSIITGNGDKTKPCFYLHDDGTLLRTTCDGGGILSYGFAMLNRTEVTGNKGIGIHVRKDLDFNTGKSCANTAGDLLVSGSKNLIDVLTCDIDQDGISDEIENLAANNGDGNNDGILDSQQADVSSFLTPTAAPITLSGKSGSGGDGSVKLQSVHGGGDAYGNRTVKISLPLGMVGFGVQNGLGSAAPNTLSLYDPLSSDIFTVTIFSPPGARIKTYWAYGPTADNAVPHWYEFLFDGNTGAEIMPDRIILHFIDGQRGDDDLTANGVVVHNGGPGELRFNEIADALVALQVLAGMEVQTAYRLSAMDLNGDGKIGLEEALYILQVVAGIRE